MRPCVRVRNRRRGPHRARKKPQEAPARNPEAKPIVNESRPEAAIFMEANNRRAEFGTAVGMGGLFDQPEVLLKKLGFERKDQSGK